MLGVKREPHVNVVKQLIAPGSITTTTNGTGLDSDPKQREETIIANVGTVTDILAGFITIQDSPDNLSWSFVEQIPLLTGVYQKRIHRKQRYIRVRVVVEPATAGTPNPSVPLSVNLLQ